MRMLHEREENVERTCAKFLKKSTWCVLAITKKCCKYWRIFFVNNFILPQQQTKLCECIEIKKFKLLLLPYIYEISKELNSMHELGNRERRRQSLKQFSRSILDEVEKVTAPHLPLSLPFGIYKRRTFMIDTKWWNYNDGRQKIDEAFKLLTTTGAKNILAYLSKKSKIIPRLKTNGIFRTRERERAAVGERLWKIISVNWLN